MSNSDLRRPHGARLPPDVDPPDGPAFVLISREDGNPFRPFNPFVMHRELKAICPAPGIKFAKYLHSGSMLLGTHNIEQSRALLSISSLVGKPAKAQLATHLTSVQGLVHSPELCDMTEQELLDELAPQGVIEVQRLKSHTDKPNPLVRLRFRGLTLPDRLFCAFLSIRIKPWVELPKQCHKCWRNGHVDRTWRSRTSTCGVCV